MRARDATFAVVVAAAIAAGCKSDRPSGTGAASAGWIAQCTTAVTEATAAPPRQRADVLLAGCQVCGTSWAPLLAAERGDVRPADILSVVDACGGTCRGNARSSLADALAEAARGDAPSLPWRQLARDCPATVGVDEATARHASATWYALHRVATAIATAARDGKAPADLTMAAMGLVIPLPARSVAGTGFRLPSSAHVDPRLARLHVTVTATETTVGALPLARLGKQSVELVPVPGAPYPGAPISLDKLPAQLDALGHELEPGVGDLDGPLVIAPQGLPASRLLEVLRAVGDRRVYLGAFGPGAPAKTVGAVDIPAGLSAAFAGRAPGRAIAVRLGGGGAIGISGGWGGLATTTALPPGPSPETQRAAEAAARIAAANPTGAVVAIDVTDGVTVEDVARLIDALIASGVTTVVAAPSLRWPTKFGAFDEAALRAAHVAPTPAAPASL